MTPLRVRTDGRPTSRDLITDSAVAVALAVLLTVGTYFASRHQPTRRSFDGGAIALLLAATGALAMRPRFPGAPLAGVFGATVLHCGVGSATGPVWSALLLAHRPAILP